MFALVVACAFQHLASQFYFQFVSFSVLFVSGRVFGLFSYSGILCDYLLYAVCTAQYTILCIVCLWNGYWAACAALFSIPFG